MSSTFPRSFALLARPTILAYRSLWLALGFLVAWGTWLSFGRVALYAASAAARVEAHGAMHPVVARVAGRVVATRGGLGQSVPGGATLVELDAEEERKHLEREQAQLSSLARQIELLRRQTAALERSAVQADAGAGLATDEAGQRYQEALAAAGLAATEAERAAGLRAQGLLAETEYERLKTEADKRGAVAAGLKSGRARTESERAAGDAGQVARRAELERLIETLEGGRRASLAAVAAAAEALDKHVVRAPASGRLAEWADLQVGAFVKEGERLGALLQPSTLKLVAQFEPSAALGRIRAGQDARMRLDGFPWTQYGTLSAKVTFVAEELRDERVRVELDLDPSTRAPVTLQHGLPGLVEVEVERVSPAVLVLRWVGAQIAPAQSAPR